MLAVINCTLENIYYHEIKCEASFLHNVKLNMLHNNAQHTRETVYSGFLCVIQLYGIVIYLCIFFYIMFLLSKFLFVVVFLNVYFWKREKERERGRAQVLEGQREGSTESEAGSRLWAVSIEPDAELEPRNCEIMTWAEVGSLPDWAIQAPRSTSLFYGTTRYSRLILYSLP